MKDPQKLWDTCRAKCNTVEDALVLFRKMLNPINRNLGFDTVIKATAKRVEYPSIEYEVEAIYQVLEGVEEFE